MSVVDIEIPDNTEKPKIFWLKKFICEECHIELSTKMNIGLPKRGVCERCGATRHILYMVEK